jgi:hypothetical protein
MYNSIFKLEIFARRPRWKLCEFVPVNSMFQAKTNSKMGKTPEKFSGYVGW